MKGYTFSPIAAFKIYMLLLLLLVADDDPILKPLSHWTPPPPPVIMNSNRSCSPKTQYVFDKRCIITYTVYPNLLNLRISFLDKSAARGRRFQNIILLIMLSLRFTQFSKLRRCYIWLTNIDNFDTLIIAAKLRAKHYSL